jgi:hypothetical protein
MHVVKRCKAVISAKISSRARVLPGANASTARGHFRPITFLNLDHDSLRRHSQPGSAAPHVVACLTALGTIDSICLSCSCMLLERLALADLLSSSNSEYKQWKGKQVLRWIGSQA